MFFRSLNATFGKLEHRELAFSPQLNIIEAPNESGKSTLSAFLRVMLYGMATRERGTLADKNRYMPWSGSAMQGRLDLDADGEVITITRDTARANSPMGRFSAVYTGTATPVDGLSAADCGETLLGVPREVYERSAFVRQSGLSIDQTAELERRIAALITTGEEDVSYSEAEAVLRRQLNARRHNKTGRLPALDAEIERTTTALTQLRTFSQQKRQAEEQLVALQAQHKALRADLERHTLAERYEQQQSVLAAAHEAEQAASKYELFRQMLVGTPPREALEQGRAKLHTLSELDTQCKSAEAALEDARKAHEAFLAQTYNMTKAASPLSAILAAVLLLGGVALFAVLRQILLTSVLVGASLACIGVYAAACKRAKAASKAYDAERAKVDAALQQAQSAADALRTTYDSALAALRADIPAESPAQAERYIADALSRYDTLVSLEREARDAQLRYELMSRQLPADTPAEPVARPACSRTELSAALAACETQIREATRTADFAAGRCRSLGDECELLAALDETEHERETLQGEYDAIVLAMASLERANTALQNRFSPALGKRAAELFERLTDSKYRAVLLDRELSASAEESGSPVAREVALLSQGAADQLYLAVRLAICEMVLPAEKNIPLVLDDALTNFDDARCAAALELLLEESKHRQILLFTCQRREAEYLRDRAGVNVLTL